MKGKKKQRTLRKKKVELNKRSKAEFRIRPTITFDPFEKSIAFGLVDIYCFGAWKKNKLPAKSNGSITLDNK